MNSQPQQSSFPAWSRLRYRLTAFFKDLNPFKQRQKDAASGFTLRKLFAVVWVIAAVTVTWRFDLAAMLLVGVPVGLLGYCLLAYGKVRPAPGVLFMVWGIAGYYYCFVLPYSKTRIKDFPPTTSNLYAEGDWFCERVRFSASVDDCRLTAQKLVAEDQRYFSKVQPNPRPIDKKMGQLATKRMRTGYEQRPWWFDPQNIEIGWQYDFTFTQIWIDSERGLFYYEFLD